MQTNIINYRSILLVIILYVLNPSETYGYKYEMEGLWELKSEKIGTEDQAYKYILITKSKIEDFKTHAHELKIIMFDNIVEFQTSEFTTGYRITETITRSTEQIVRMTFYPSRKKYRTYSYEFNFNPKHGLNLTIEPYGGWIRKDNIPSTAMYQKTLDSHKYLIKGLEVDLNLYDYFHGAILNYSAGILAYQNFEFEKAKQFLDDYVSYCNINFKKSQVNNVTNHYLEAKTNAKLLLKKINFILLALNESNKFIILPWTKNGESWPIQNQTEIFLLCQNKIFKTLKLTENPSKDKWVIGNSEFSNEAEINDYLLSQLISCN